MRISSKAPVSEEYSAAAEPAMFQVIWSAFEMPEMGVQAGLPLGNPDMRWRRPPFDTTALSPPGAISAALMSCATGLPNMAAPGTPRIGRILEEEASNTKPATIPAK